MKGRGFEKRRGLQESKICSDGFEKINEIHAYIIGQAVMEIFSLRA